MKKALIWFLTILWLALLLRFTVFRDGCFSHGPFSGRIEWDAFAYYAKLARIGYWRYFIYLFVGNLVWFVPVGLLVRMREPQAVAHRRAPLQRFPLLRAALWGFLLSLGIETMQYVLGSGVSELDDLILNTAGAILGYGFPLFFFRVKEKISKKRKKPLTFHRNCAKLDKPH